MHILKALQVFDPEEDKVRVGNVNDGGYVILPSFFEESTRLITLGVGNDDGFETDWIGRAGGLVEMYDGTCLPTSLSFRNSSVMFVQSNVGDRPDQISLSTILTDKNSYVLKVDIEGAEYNIFGDTEDKKAEIRSHLTRCVGIIIEIHDVYLPENQVKIVDLLTNVMSDFRIVHIHGNSWGGHHEMRVSSTGLGYTCIPKFPNVLELTLVNIRNYGMSMKLSSEIRSSQDASNNPDCPDFELHWINSL